jgi:uracil phosphoribosyltransferase
MNLTVVDHPVAQHLLAALRDRSTPPATFRAVTKRLAWLLLVEASRDLPVRAALVHTPLEDTDARMLAEPVVVVPILRAGLGLLDAATELLPEVMVGYLGLERDEATFEPSAYYANLPPMKGSRTFILDPMLATGGSARSAIASVKKAGAADVRMVAVVAAPEGIAAVHSEHPDVHIVTASVDRGLNDAAYILPGLGDFGDRLFGTLPQG